MSSIIPRIYKVVTPYLKKNGFKKKGCCFYKVQNDMAFCLEYDYPGGLVYSHFYVIPLYIPCQVRYMNYGNRLEAEYRDQISHLSGDSSDEDIDMWFNSIKSLLEEEVFPLFEQICTPQKLLHFIDRPREEWEKYFDYCSVCDALQLKMYTCMYLHQFEQAREAISAYRMELKGQRCYTEKLKASLEAEIDYIEEIINKGSEEVEAYCMKTCMETREKWFPENKRTKLVK